MSANTTFPFPSSLREAWTVQHPSSGAIFQWDPSYQSLSLEGRKRFRFPHVDLHSHGYFGTVRKDAVPSEPVVEEILRYYLTLLFQPFLEKELRDLLDFTQGSLNARIHLDLLLPHVPSGLTPRQQASWCLTEFVLSNLRVKGPLPPPVRDEAWRLSYIDETLAAPPTTINAFLRAFIPSCLLWGEENWLPVYFISGHAGVSTSTKTLEGLAAMRQVLRGLQAPPTEEESRVGSLPEANLAPIFRNHSIGRQFASLPMRSREMREYLQDRSVGELKGLVGKVRKGGDTKTTIAICNSILQKRKEEGEVLSQDPPWRDIYTTLGDLIFYLEAHDERFFTTPHQGERTLRDASTALGSLRREHPEVYKLLKSFLQEQKERDTPSKALSSILPSLLHNSDAAFSKGQALEALIPHMRMRMDATAIVDTLHLLRVRNVVLTARQWNAFLQEYDAYKDMPGDWWLPLVTAA